MRRRWLRRLLLSLLGLIPLLVFLAFGVLWLTVPPDNQKLRIPGLSAPVDIRFDDNGVPWIRAANERDAATALGFVQARDRMFQMDLMRRTASGRLSELFGPETLAIDKQMRVFGLARLAEGDVAAQSPETRALLEAYATGVNAWIAARGRFASMESLFLGTPEPWRPADTLMWGRIMSLWLSSNYRTELSRLALRDKVPRRMLEQLWPPHPAPPPPDARLSGGDHAFAQREPAQAPSAELAPSHPADLGSRRPADLGSRRPADLTSRHPANLTSRHPADLTSRHPPARPGDQSTQTPGLADGPVKPGHDEAALGHDEAAPGHDEAAPGHDEAALGHDEAALGRDEAAPGHDEAAPGHDEAAPGHDKAAPGQDGVTGVSRDNLSGAGRLRPAAAAAVLAALPAFPAPFTLPATASDAWAVDGRWSDTGAPLLAGDPHLSFDFPGLWYLVRVETPGHLLVGATAPGGPLLVLGHNGHIAWTFVTSGVDTQDVYLEPPEAKFTAHQERIKVRGQPDVVITVRETRHGPVISDLSPTGASGPVLAVAMVNLLPRDTGATGLLALNHARTVEEAGKAAPLIASPVQNLMVADRTKIGLFVTGRVPIRREGDGWAPVPGITDGPVTTGMASPPTNAEPPTAQTVADPPAAKPTGAATDDAHGWSGFASGDDLPHIVGPASGRLVNANEPAWPANFPVFMGTDTFSDWRARRIRALLDSSPLHSTSDFAAMQVDVVSTYAAALLPTLRVVPGAPQVLRDWDGAMTENAPQPLIFSAWMQAFHHAVLERAHIPRSASSPVFEFVPFVLSAQGASWCGGDCAPLLKATLDSTMAALAARFGPDPNAWRWGAVHQAVFAHPILRSVPVLGALTTSRIAVPGDGATLDRGGTNEALEAVHGASYRGVYDLADLDRSLFIVTPGQSGNPLSRHARDFLTRWRDGALILLARQPVEVSGTVRLEP